MQLCATIDNRTGKRRYYIDGKRCTRERFEDCKRGRVLDTFHTITRADKAWHYCSARKAG